MSQCFSCQLDHPRVEGSGINHCPNRLCPGSGGFWFRAHLPRYQELPDNRYSVDREELIRAVLSQPAADPVVHAAEMRLLDKWRQLEPAVQEGARPPVG